MAWLEFAVIAAIIPTIIPGLHLAIITAAFRTGRMGIPLIAALVPRGVVPIIVAAQIAAGAPVFAWAIRVRFTAVRMRAAACGGISGMLVGLRWEKRFVVLSGSGR
jgi:hypothetical protein